MMSAQALLRCRRTQALLAKARGLGLADTLELVDLRWLLESVSHWQRLPERDFRLPEE